MSASQPRGWLVLLLLATYATDVALTLTGQPAAYWDGNYGLAIEANPLAYPLLTRSPWMFVAGALVWATVLGAIVLRWQHRAAQWLAWLFIVGHAFGGACWLARHGAVGWGFVFVYLVAVLSFAERVMAGDRPSSRPPRT